MLCCNCGREPVIAKVGFVKFGPMQEESLCWMCIEAKVNGGYTINKIRFTGSVRATTKVIDLRKRN